MHGSAKPSIRRLSQGAWLTEQGEPGRDVFLLLDGMLSVAVDGSVLGEVGPGAVVGERAALTDGRRTASLQALTDCVVAVAAHDQIDQGKLAVLAEGHRREEQQ
jgi:CRP-like cAMP-binding protein